MINPGPTKDQTMWILYHMCLIPILYDRTCHEWYLWYRTTMWFPQLLIHPKCGGIDRFSHNEFLWQFIMCHQVMHRFVSMFQFRIGPMGP